MPSMFLPSNRLLSALGLALAGFLSAAISLHAQRAPLPLGTINPQKIIRLDACPLGFFPGMTCFHGVVENCPRTLNLGFTYGLENPSHQESGTIAFLEGGGGTDPSNNPAYAQNYLQAGYQILYLAWDTPWEFTGSGTGNSIKNAACRPATVLNYFHQNVYSRGGMCAQGLSAGAGAVAYSLAWYGSASYLDNVELLSGPVFGDIEQGCVVPNPVPLNVCGGGEFGCDGAPWLDSPSYLGTQSDLVSAWTGQRGCNALSPTTQVSNSSWKIMSIVDGTATLASVIRKPHSQVGCAATWTPCRTTPPLKRICFIVSSPILARLRASP